MVTAAHRRGLLGLCLSTAVLVADVRVAGADPATVGDAGAHLLAGVRAFRADRHEEALREFRLVEQAGGSEDLALYLGPTLYKLERFEEARAVLARAHRAGVRDAVADYYLGLSYQRLGLGRLARAIFSSLDVDSAGPRLAAGAARFVAAIDGERARGTVADLLAAAERGPADLAFDQAAEAWLRSASGSPERSRAAALVVRHAEPAGAAVVALDLLDGDASLPVDLRLSLLRVLLRAGATARARPLFDDIRRRGDAASRTAAEELARGRL